MISPKTGVQQSCCYNLHFHLKGPLPMTCLLLTLYDTILVPILSEWASDGDLCFLDTAVCNTIHRPSFLATVARCSIDNITFRGVDEIDIYEWILLRGIKLKKLSLLDDDEPQLSQLLSIVAKTKSVSHLVINLFAVPANAFLGVQITVHTLEVWACDNESLLLLLSLLNSIVHLDISKCTDLSIDTYSKIAKLCPSLSCIQLSPIGVLPVSSSTIDCEINFKTDCLTEPCLKRKLYSYFKLSSSTCLSDTALSINGRLFNLIKFKLRSYYEALKLTEGDVEQISKHCASLNILELRLSDSYPLSRLKKTLDKCFNLREFVAGSVRFGENDLELICKNNSHHLRLLRIHNCDGIVEADIVAASRHCPNLTELSITETSMCDTSFNLLQLHCPLLSSISISSFTSDAISIARGFGSASFYHGNGNQLEINRKNRLRHLKSFTRIFQKIEFFEQNVDLVNIEFYYVPITNAVLDNLVRYCPSLRIFAYVHEGETICVNWGILGQCKQLTSVDIQNLMGVKDHAIELLLQGKPNLLKLILDSSSGFTSRVCSLVAKYCPRIRILNVAGASDPMKCEDVVDLLNKCPHIHSLKLYCSSEEEESKIEAGLPRKLRHLYLAIDGDFF